MEDVWIPLAVRDDPAARRVGYGVGRRRFWQRVSGSLGGMVRKRCCSGASNPMWMDHIGTSHKILMNVITTVVWEVHKQKHGWHTVILNLWLDCDRFDGCISYTKSIDSNRSSIIMMQAKVTFWEHIKTISLLRTSSHCRFRFSCIHWDESDMDYLGCVEWWVYNITDMYDLC